MPCCVGMHGMQMEGMTAASLHEDDAQLAQTPCCTATTADVRAAVMTESLPTLEVAIPVITPIQAEVIALPVISRIAAESPPGSCGARVTIARHCSFLI